MSLMITEIEEISQCMKSLILSERWSDVTFLVGTARLPAHRLILKARSQYFRALLDGGMRESNEREIALDVPSEEIACDLLTFLYTGCLNCETKSTDHLLDLLLVADKFDLDVFQHKLGEVLGSKLTEEHAFVMLRTARLLHMQDLEKKCMHFIHSNAKELLKHSSFFTLTMEEIEDLVKHDAFLAPEVEILQGVLAWAENLPPSERQTQAERVLRHVRYSLITMAEALSLLQNTPYMLQLLSTLTQTKQSHPPRKNPVTPHHAGVQATWLPTLGRYLPDEALRGGTDHGHQDLYVARAHFEGNLIPGKYREDRGLCYIAFSGCEISPLECEVMCENEYEVQWIELPTDRDGNTFIPETAVNGGYTANGETLFVGRMRHLGTDTIGKVPANLKRCIIGYDGREVESEHFELLVMEGGTPVVQI